MVDAVRSAIGRHNGGLSGVRPDDLLAAASVGMGVSTLVEWMDN